MVRGNDAQVKSLMSASFSDRRGVVLLEADVGVVSRTGGDTDGSVGQDQGIGGIAIGSTRDGFGDA